MKGRISAFFVVVMVALTFYGCSGTGTSTGTTDQNFHVGTTGLSINFMPNSPPPEIYDGKTFPFILEIYNKGVTDTNPYLTLTGFDPNIVKIGWSSTQPGLITGKSYLNPVGGYAVIEDKVTATLPDGVDTFTTPVIVIGCYEYATEGVASVCMDPNPSNNDDDVCTARLVSLSGGQGAPVAITKIDVRPSMGITYFIITISNLDKSGEVISAGKVSTCTEQLTYQDMDIVEVTSAKVGTQSMTCEPSTIKLINGVGTTSCEIATVTDTAYTTTLLLNLKYGFKTSLTKSLNIRRI